jgi:hypothetical protein
MSHDNQLSQTQKHDALLKLHNLAENVYNSNVENSNLNEAMLGYSDLMTMKIFLSLYSIILSNEDLAFDLVETFEPIKYWESFYDLKDKNKRNDDGIEENIPVILLYYYFIYNQTSFQLSDQFMFLTHQFIAKNSYYYNTENEDGNKTEYEDLPQVEKKYTDAIMDNINTLKDLKNALKHPINTVDDITLINSTDLLNYLQDSIGVMFSSFPEVLEYALERMFQTVQLYTHFYTEHYFEQDYDLRSDPDYRKLFINFITDDIFHDFTMKLTEPGIYFL